MKHEVDLSKYEIRTDLVIEKEKENFINNEEEIDNIKITRTKLNKDNLIKNKEKGVYITIEFDDVTDSENYEKVKKILVNNLKYLIKETNIKDDSFYLVVGLGNRNSTPDAIGPLTIDNVIVTNHIYLYDELDSNYKRVSAIVPNVTASTGIETSDYIKGIVSVLKPDAIIVIDALASRSLKRVNKTIQLSNTGITPGSGVGNNRSEISKNTLGVPVIAIGIPTVVDAVSVVADTINFMEKHYAFYKDFLKLPLSKIVPSGQINYLNKQIDTNLEDNKKILGIIGSLSEDELRNLLFEVLTPINYNMIVTPKEVDFIVDKISKLIGEAINHSLHNI